MSWSANFRPNADPLYFYPELDLQELQKKNNSVEPVPNLDRLIDNVVAEINTEGKKIDPNFNITLADIRGSIPSDFNTLNYRQKFNSTVNLGRNRLANLRNKSVNNTDFKKFYEQYYFYTPTEDQIKSIKETYKTQDYGFGTSEQQNQKLAALNRSISYGLLPAETTLVEYEAFVSPSNKERFVNRLLQLNGQGSKAIISPEKIQSNPTEAAYALLQLTENGKLKVDTTGKYQWTSGNNWKTLKDFNNGVLLNTYQDLVVRYENSDASKNGVSLSQFIAQDKRDVYKEIESRVANQKLNVNTSKENIDQAQKIVEASIKTALDSQIQSSQSKQAEQQQKINLLRLDAYRESQKTLSSQEEKEARNKELFGSMNDMFQSISQELGVKEGFFKAPGFQSNINFNWQNWFETELRNRYNPDSNKNVLGRIQGLSQEDAELGRKFIQDFLQRRFDSSKSLSEFVNYVDPRSFNPVLEEKFDSSLQKLSDQSYFELTGSIEDKSSILGNFWTNMQLLWQKGRSFDSDYYLNQSLGKIKGEDLSVSQLHNNIAAMHDIALKNNSIYLDPNEVKELNLVGVNLNSKQEIEKQIDLYQNWFYKAYENGVNLSNATEFAKLHYDNYIKNADDPSLGLQAGRRLFINNPNLFTESEAKQINDQVSFLTKKAEDYLTDIQFGKFKTPEEYLMDMLKKSGIIDTGNASLFGDAGLSDVVKQYIEQFSGAISSYAGEMIRNQIQTIIDTGKMPNQKELGIEYIQRTKDQALSTIRSLISKDVFQNQIKIVDAPGMALNQSMSDWFSQLGLSLIPGEAWEEYKRENNISIDKSFTDWEASEGKKINQETSLSNQRMFWNYWASKNNVKIIESLDPDKRNESRITLLVDSPSPSWVAWAKRITSDKDNESQLQGASVSVRTDAFNADWYSKTNPYTKIKDEWNRIVGNPNQNVLDTKGKNLSEWAKTSGLNPEQAWIEYRTEQQKTNPKFGKDVAGNDMSFVTWSQNASESDIDRFWNNSNEFWFNYLKSEDINIIKGGTSDRPEFKKWSEWAIENNIELKRAGLGSDEMPPDRFLQIHYYTLGGSDKVNQEYLKTYFPEFTELENQGLIGQTELSKSPFDLSAFGFSKEEMIDTSTPGGILSQKSKSPIDFAMQQMFGDSMDGDSFESFDSNQSQNINLKPLDDFNLKFDMSYNKTKSKNTDFTNFDFGFGDFGGNGFGF